MDLPQCCRTCLSEQNLNLIFPLPEHSEKYTEVIYSTTGVKVQINDNLPQQMCAPCIDFINQCYKFKKKCQDTEKTLLRQLQEKPFYEIKIEQNNFATDIVKCIDIVDLLIDNDFRDYDDNITLSEYYLEIEKHKDSKNNQNDNKTQNIEQNTFTATNSITDQKLLTKNTKVRKKCTQNKGSEIKKRGRTKKENEEEKRTKEKKERVKETIQCELCHKVLTSKLSLRNHNKIHTGFDVVCEHCGKKFITRRLLLMHCKAKHGYEKTDKCSYCDYRASNAEQVKIHERLHTGEKPYACAVCAARFHRKSSYLQHVAIHLPDKTVQCDQCPARFKSVTLMRIHRARHAAPRYTYLCRVCDNTFARRRNVVRHLMRIHALRAATEHIHRMKNS